MLRQMSVAEALLLEARTVPLPGCEHRRRDRRSGLVALSLAPGQQHRSTKTILKRVREDRSPKSFTLEAPPASARQALA
jgi:hypothetical protein